MLAQQAEAAADTPRIERNRKAGLK